MWIASALFVIALTPKQATFDATYVATVSNIPANTRALKVWIPLPANRAHQWVSNVTIDSPLPFERHVDRATGNHYAFAAVMNPGAEIRVPVRFTVRRYEALAHSPDPVARDLSRALEADRLVTLSPRVRQLANKITKGKTTPLDKARAIYDHVLLTMRYDKTIAGWGQGDTERACDIRAGNCTDFHSLFLSLARASGIPSRFVIGFPLTAADGNVAGYHCWAEFYVKGEGWLPVDASDAWKSQDASTQAYLFGNLDPKRVEFTVGRDLELQPPTSEPLNFFIYPRAEAGGKPVGNSSIALTFREAVHDRVAPAVHAADRIPAHAGDR